MEPAQPLPSEHDWQARCTPLASPFVPERGDEAPAYGVSSGIRAAKASGAGMRSYDPWDTCVTMVKSWGNLKWVTAALMERLPGEGQLHPCPIVTSVVMGAGLREAGCASGLLSWRGRQGGRREGGGPRHGERLSGSASGCGCTSVEVCGCVCAPCWGEGGAALTEAPCPPAPAQACFLPKLLMSLQLQKPGDL